MTCSTLGALRLLAGPGTGTKEQPKVESEGARGQLLDLWLSNVCGGLRDRQAIQNEVISSCGLKFSPGTQQAAAPQVGVYWPSCDCCPCWGRGWGWETVSVPSLSPSSHRADQNQTYCPVCSASGPVSRGLTLGVLPSVLRGGGYG